MSGNGRREAMKSSCEKITNLDKTKNVFDKIRSWQSNPSSKATNLKQVASNVPVILDQCAQMRRDIAALARMFEERVTEGWGGYLLSFMFQALSGTRDSKLTRMKGEVERVYYRLQKRTVRYRKNSSTRVPIFFGAPDFSFDGNKGLIISGESHDGLHFHVAALTPPEARYERRVGTLDAHIQMQIQSYVPSGGILLRLHCQPFTQTYGNAVHYALKGLYWFGRDELIILPENYQNQQRDDDVHV